MAPLVRRTWSWRGARPQLQQKGKHREKVSVAAALCLSPAGDRLRLIFQTRVNGYFNNERTADFVRHLLRRIRSRLVALWDGGSMHKGDPIRALVAEHGSRLSLERLPPYAPMLNPVEPIWSWLKYGRLSNFVPHDAVELNERIHAVLTPVCHDQGALHRFWHASDLPLPRALLM
jgi:putative transposase